MAMRRTTMDGKVVNVRTAQMLRRAQARLGENLHVIQGSYNAGGVSASAGTHDGGGAVDLSPTNNPDRVVKALREVGFAAWHRRASQGPWNDHIHAIALDDPELSSGAAAQVTEYINGYDGLAGNGLDDGPRLDPIPRWPVKLKPVSLERIKKQFAADKPRKTLAVQRVQKLLNYRLGTDLKVDGVPGPKTKEVYKRWEESLDIKDADRKPNAFSLKKLFAGWFVLSK